MANWGFKLVGDWRKDKFTDNQTFSHPVRGDTKPVVFPSVKLKTASQLLKESWKVYCSKIRTLLGIMLILIVAPVVLFLLLYLAGPHALVFFILVLLMIIVMILLSLLVTPSLIYATKEDIGVAESLKKAFKILPSYIWVAFLAGLIILGGYGLFIIPGIIFSVWFCLVYYVLIFDEKKGMDALLRSKDLVSGRWWKVFWRFLFFDLVILLVAGAVFLPIVFLLRTYAGESIYIAQLASNIIQAIFSFFLTPLGLVYGVSVYQNVKETRAVELYQEPTKKRKLKYILIGILGTLLLVGTMIGLIVLSFMTTSDGMKRAKGARIIADLSQVRTIAAIINADEDSYKALCNPAHKLNKNYPSYGEELETMEDDINAQYKGNDLKCYSSADKYCVQVRLWEDEYYCIDSTGQSGTNPTDPGCSATSLKCNLQEWK